ncbi:MAG TPA: alkaline phosphatase D family protein, partial [Acidimicrobiia bacterium]|nr:alkaline phosphatase D family protein [Acidimicrobiia bacterium]
RLPTRSRLLPAMDDSSAPGGISRRTFLGGGLATTLAATALPRGYFGPVAATQSATAYPFKLGVASGDPLADGVILWTRLAPDPLAGGGMPANAVKVRWQVASDEGMRTIVKSGTATARSEHAHSVHVDVRGLDPARPYWYRFVAGDDETEIARTRTAPAEDALAKRIRMAHVSCQRWDSGYYTAYADLAKHDLDLVVHVGDYIYEYSGGPVRDPAQPIPVSLEDYRNRYGLYKGDANLQAAHAIAPFVVTWDDHDVENNYTSEFPQPGSPTPDKASFLARRAGAYQAWWEHLPVRLPAPRGPDYPIFRRVPLGRLATVHVLDSRQYRTDQTCGTGDVGPRCDVAFDPETTVLGAEQERWLTKGLKGPQRWNVLANQVVMQQWRFAPGNEVWNLDQWDGYPVARDRMFAAMGAREVGDNVVLTGDAHSSWVGTLAADLDDAASEVLGVELVGPGISSVPSSALPSIEPAIHENSPHLRWSETTRTGWVRHDVTPADWRAEYRLVDDARVEGSPVTSASSWVIGPGGQIDEA